MLLPHQLLTLEKKQAQRSERKGKNMNDTITIRRSYEEGMYLLREGDRLWRVNEDGVIDCAAQGHSPVFDLLASVQQWRTPSRRLFQHYPLQEPTD